MANRVSLIPTVAGTPGSSTAGHVAYYICDTDAGKPVTGLNVGDLCWAVDTGRMWVAISSTTWAAIGLASSQYGSLVLTGESPSVSFHLVDTIPVLDGWLNVGVDTSIPLAGVDLTFPNDNGVIAMQPIPTTPHVRTPALGLSADPPPAGEIGTVNQTGKTAAIASTIMVNGASSGLYRISYFLRCTTADVTAGTIQFGVTYTDSVGATTESSAVVALTSTVNRAQGVIMADRASGNITYATTLVGIAGTSQYKLRARCEYLG